MLIRMHRKQQHYGSLGTVAAGAGAGFLVAGPVGAVIGGVAGALIKKKTPVSASASPSPSGTSLPVVDTPDIVHLAPPPPPEVYSQPSPTTQPVAQPGAPVPLQRPQNYIPIGPRSPFFSPRLQGFRDAKSAPEYLPGALMLGGVALAAWYLIKNRKR